MTKFLNIIGCSAAKYFANDLALLHRIKPLLVEKQVFPGNELSVILPNIDCDKPAIVIQNLISANNDLMELLLTLEALKAMYIPNITVIIPYLAYARQDKSYNSQSNTPNIAAIARILNSYQIDKLIFCDIHNPNSIEYFHNAINLTFFALLTNYILTNNNAHNLLVVSPDAGSNDRAQKLANLLHCPYTSLTKKREGQNIEIVGCVDTDHSIFFQKDVIIIDDILASGATVNEAAIFLKSQRVNSITVCVTHLFHPAININNLVNIDKLIYTNTVSAKQLEIPHTFMVSIVNSLSQSIKS